MMANDTASATWKGVTGTVANGEHVLRLKWAPENCLQKKEAKNSDFYKVFWFVHILSTAWMKHIFKPRAACGQPHASSQVGDTRWVSLVLRRKIDPVLTSSNRKNWRQMIVEITSMVCSHEHQSPSKIGKLKDKTWDILFPSSQWV